MVEGQHIKENMLPGPSKSGSHGSSDRKDGTLTDCYVAIRDMALDPRADLRVKSICNMGLSYFPLGIHTANAEGHDHDPLQTDVLMRLLEAIRTVSPDIFFDNIAVSSDMMPRIDKYHAEAVNSPRSMIGHGHKVLDKLGFRGLVDKLGSGQKNEMLIKELGKREKLQICLHLKFLRWKSNPRRLFERILADESSDGESITMMSTVSQVMLDHTIMDRTEITPRDRRNKSDNMGIVENILSERTPLHALYRRGMGSLGLQWPIASMPELINVSLDLMGSDSASWHSKLYLNCALAYMMIPVSSTPIPPAGNGVMNDALVLSMALYNFFHVEDTDESLMVWDSHMPGTDPYSLLMSIINQSYEAITNLTGEPDVHNCLQLTGHTVIDEFLSWASYDEGTWTDRFINWLKTENSNMLYTIKKLEKFRGAYSGYRNAGEVMNKLTPEERIRYDWLYERLGQPHLEGVNNPRSELEKLRIERLLMM